MGELLQPMHLLIILLLFVVGPVWFVPFWIIFRRAGLELALSLLMLVPGVNIAMLWYLAVAEWPSIKQGV